VRLRRRPALRDEVIRLGPWAHDVEVARGIRTSAWLEAPPDTYPESLGPIPSIGRDGDRFKSVLAGVYPEGLGGRRVLDCACNCGVYLL
jgi:tRNA (mo5U34)-methyltransferase